MPRLLDPHSSIDVVLQSDADKPKDRQPTFHVRVLSKRDWLDFGRRYDETFSAKPAADPSADDQAAAEDQAPPADSPQDAAAGRLDKRYELARWVLKGWKNMRTAEGTELPFDSTPMEDVLDPWELMELLDQALAGGRLNFEQKKTSASPA